MTFDFELTNFAWNGSDVVVGILANRKIFLGKDLLLPEKIGQNSSANKYQLQRKKPKSWEIRNLKLGVLTSFFF
jgi:hypothetical protein